MATKATSDSGPSAIGVKTGADDGFDAFFALDFNTEDRADIPRLVATYFNSDVAFGTKRGTYGLKHI